LPNVRTNARAGEKTLIRSALSSATYRLPESSKARPTGPKSAPPSVENAAVWQLVVQTSRPPLPPAASTSNPKARANRPSGVNTLTRSLSRSATYRSPASSNASPWGVLSAPAWPDATPALQLAVHTSEPVPALPGITSFPNARKNSPERENTLTRWFVNSAT